jgi:hypothetical protein
MHILIKVGIMLVGLAAYLLGGLWVISWVIQGSIPPPGSLPGDDHYGEEK